MSLHYKAINNLTPADYLVIQEEHRLLEKYLSDLHDACACSKLDQLPDCQNCDHEKQAHAGIMQQLYALSDACLSLRNQGNTTQIYHQFHEKLSHLFAAHDRSFDDPFIQSTQI